MTTSTEKKTPQRIYLVRDVLAEKPTSYLVKAATKAQAIGHVVTGQYDAKVATQDELVAAIIAGAKVETAGEDDQAGG